MLASELIAKLQAEVEANRDTLVAVRAVNGDWETVGTLDHGEADTYVRNEGWSFGLPALRLHAIDDD